MELASTLQATVAIHGDGFDWQRFAKYATRLSVLCLAVAVVSVATDGALQRLLRRVLALPAGLRAALTAGLAASAHGAAAARQRHYPLLIWTNEAVHAVGALLSALAAHQLLEVLETLQDAQVKSRYEGERRRVWWGTTNMGSWVLLLLAVIYGVVGVLTGSNFIWSCGMIVFGAWFGAMFGYLPGVYFIGMEYPSRTALLGLVILGTSSLMRLWPPTTVLWSTTRIWGLLYLFISLWILSIGARDQMFESKGAPAHHISPRAWLFIWSLIFAVAASFCIWYGLHHGDGTMKGFGLTFLGINLYTKFFEAFWSRWYKPLFFAVLAGSLALAGRHAETVWNLRIASL